MLNIEYFAAKMSHERDTVFAPPTQKSQSRLLPSLHPALGRLSLANGEFRKVR
jgi:hypothetical protein